MGKTDLLTLLYHFVWQDRFVEVWEWCKIVVYGTIWNITSLRLIVIGDHLCLSASAFCSFISNLLISAALFKCMWSQQLLSKL